MSKHVSADAGVPKQSITHKKRGQKGRVSEGLSSSLSTSKKHPVQVKPVSVIDICVNVE